MYRFNQDWKVTLDLILSELQAKGIEYLRFCKNRKDTTACKVELWPWLTRALRLQQTSSFVSVDGLNS